MFLLFLFFPPLIYMETIKVWECAPKHLSNRCYSIETISSEHSRDKYEMTYVFQCPPTTHCQALQGYSYRYCVPNLPPGFDDDYCELNSDCFSGICYKKRCYGFKEGEECENTNQCGSQLSCYRLNKFDKKMCLPMIKEGKKCEVNDDEKNGDFGNCDKGLVCATYTLNDNNKSKNNNYPRCVKLGSLPDKTLCENPFACESGIILHNRCTYITPGKINLNPDMNICEFKTSTYDKIEEIECARTSKGVVKHPYENIHENWKKYVNTYFEFLQYNRPNFNFNHHTFYLNTFDVRIAYLNFVYNIFLSDADKCTIEYWYNSHNRLRF